MAFPDRATFLVQGLTPLWRLASPREFIPHAGKSCPICFDDITDAVRARCERGFEIWYCREHIMAWLETHNTCPHCRFAFFPPDEDEFEDDFESDDGNDRNDGNDGNDDVGDFASDFASDFEDESEDESEENSHTDAEDDQGNESEHGFLAPPDLTSFEPGQQESGSSADAQRISSAETLPTPPTLVVPVFVHDRLLSELHRRTHPHVWHNPDVNAWETWVDICGAVFMWLVHHMAQVVERGTMSDQLKALSRSCVIRHVHLSARARLVLERNRESVMEELVRLARVEWEVVDAADGLRAL